MEFGQELVGFGFEFVLFLLYFIRRWVQIVVDMISNQSLASVTLVLERRSK